VVSLLDPSLVDRWFAVYDRHMRPLGQSLPSATFSVPQNVAVWNQPAFATREGRAQINEMGEESGSEVSATALALRAATNQSGSTEGIYISLPLDGRIDLMRPQPIRPASNTPEAQPSLATSPPIYAQEFGNTAPVHPPSRQGSPPISDTWNAQYNSPPRQSGPQYGEMRGGMPENYENAWDKPLGHQKQVDAWNAVEEYPTIPNVVKEDRWYAGAADGKPDYNKVSTVFPWENKERAPPARHFPASDPPPPKSANVPALRIQLPSPPVLEELASNKSMMSPFGHGKKPMTFNQAMSGYTNAWDIPSIQQYAHRLAGPKERKALAKGMQTPALERENAQGILLSEQHDGKQKSKRPFGKRSRRQSTTDNAEATSEGSRDGDDEETTSSSEDEDEGRHPIIRRGAAGSSGSKSHSRTTSKVSAAVTHGSNPGSPLSPVGSKQYQTRSVQTESPSMQDQVVQFPSPENELTPLAKHTVIALANSARPSAVRMSSEETVTSATYSSPGANIKTPSGGEEGQSAESSTKARPTQRVFDPATSIDVSSYRPNLSTSSTLLTVDD
jgi:glycogenin glucosyltransferase